MSISSSSNPVLKSSKIRRFSWNLICIFLLVSLSEISGISAITSVPYPVQNPIKFGSKIAISPSGYMGIASSSGQPESNGIFSIMQLNFTGLQIESTGKFLNLPPADRAQSDCLAMNGDILMFGRSRKQNTPGPVTGAYQVLDRNWGGTDNWGTRIIQNGTADTGLGTTCFLKSPTEAVLCEIQKNPQSSSCSRATKDHTGPNKWKRLPPLTILGMSQTGEQIGSGGVFWNNDVILLGAPSHNTSQGRIHVHGVTTGPWNWDSAIYAPNGYQNLRFGQSFVMHTPSNKLYVGAPGYYNAGRTVGAVYIFLKNVPTYNKFSYNRVLIPSNPGNAHLELGEQLAFFDDVIVASNPMYDGGKGIIQWWGVHHPNQNSYGEITRLTSATTEKLGFALAAWDGFGVIWSAVEANTYQTNGGRVDYATACSKGEYYAGTSCQLCPADTFNNKTTHTSTSCDPCPDGFYNSGVGNNDCPNAYTQLSNPVPDLINAQASTVTITLNTTTAFVPGANTSVTFYRNFPVLSMIVVDCQANHPNSIACPVNSADFTLGEYYVKSNHFNMSISDVLVNTTVWVHNVTITGMDLTNVGPASVFPSQPTTVAITVAGFDDGPDLSIDFKFVDAGNGKETLVKGHHVFGTYNQSLESAVYNVTQPSLVSHLGDSPGTRLQYILFSLDKGLTWSLPTNLATYTIFNRTTYQDSNLVSISPTNVPIDGIITFQSQFAFPRATVGKQNQAFCRLSTDVQNQAYDFPLTYVTDKRAICALNGITHQQLGKYNLSMTFNDAAFIGLQFPVNLFEVYNATVDNIYPTLFEVNSNFSVTITGQGFPARHQVSIVANTTAQLNSPISAVDKIYDSNNMVIRFNPINITFAQITAQQERVDIYVSFNGGVNSHHFVINIHPKFVFTSMQPDIAVVHSEISPIRLNITGAFPSVIKPGDAKCIFSNATGHYLFDEPLQLSPDDWYAVCGTNKYGKVQYPQFVNVHLTVNSGAQRHFVGQLEVFDINLNNVSTPLAGPTSGGTLVTLTGSGFNHTSKIVRKLGFNTSESAPITYVDFNVVSDSKITALTPAYTGSASQYPTPFYLIINGFDEANTGNMGLEFRYIDLPTFAAITPSAGSIYSETPVSFSLSPLPQFYELVGQAACRFGSVVTPLYFPAGQNPQNFTCVSPALPNMPYSAWTTVPIEVSTNGQQFVKTSSNFTFTNHVLNGSSPSIVDKRGGIEIEVSLYGLPVQLNFPKITVKLEIPGQFNHVLETTLYAGNTRFNFTMPPVPVSITQDGTKTLAIMLSLNEGTSYGKNFTTLTLHDTFVVTPSMNPRALPIGNVINMTLFTNPSPPDIGTPMVRYTTQLNGTFVVPAKRVTSATYEFAPPVLGVAQNATVELSLNGIQWSNHNSAAPLHYRYSLNPQGTIQPLNAPNTTQGKVTIHGANFVAHQSMSNKCFMDGKITQMNIINPNLITCDYLQSVNNATQYIRVSMSNSPVVQTQASVAFPRVIQPEIFDFYPSDIPYASSEDITIVGQNFVGQNMLVFFSNGQRYELGPQVISETKLVVRTPAFSLQGPADKRVEISTNDGANTFFANNDKRLNLRNPQVFDQAVPRTTPHTGGTNITIRGNWFLPSSFGLIVKLIVGDHNGIPTQIFYLNQTLGGGASNVSLGATHQEASFITPPIRVNPPLPAPGEHEVFYKVSTNGGQSWSNQEPIDVVLAPTLLPTIPASVDVTRGTIITVKGGPFINKPESRIRITVPSTNNVTFVKPQYVNNLFQFPMPQVPFMPPQDYIEIAVTVNGQQYQTISNFKLLAYMTPQLDTIDVKSGPSLGQTKLVVSGRNFTNTSTIRAKFSSNLYSSALVPMTYVTATQLLVSTPPLSNGIQLPHQVSMKITQNAQESELSFQDIKFDFYNPSEQYQYTITPSNGPDKGGTTILVNKKPGTPAFVDTKQITIRFTNGSLDVAQSVAFNNADQLSVVAPSILPSNRQFTSFNLLLGLNGQQFNKLTNDPPTFQYHAPVTVVSVSPKVSPVTGGTTLKINCTNTLTNGILRVKFQDVVSATQRIVSDCTFKQPGEIECTAPSFQGSTVSLPMKAEITVSLNGAQYSQSSQNITYFDSPAVSSITPQNSPESGGADITITGTNLVTNQIDGVIAQARFGTQTGTKVDLKVIDDKTAVAKVPPGSAGVLPVEVSFDGETFTNNGRTITYYKNPTLQSINPVGGQFNASTPITVIGDGFPNTGTELAILLTDGQGTNATTSGNRVDGKTITFNAPLVIANNAPMPQHFNVQIAPNGLQFVGGPNIRLLYYKLAELSAMDVRSGPDSGQTWVTISGNHFVNLTSTIVSFSSQIFVTNNRVPGEFISPNAIRCRSPPINPGIVLPHDVDVTLSLNGLPAQEVTSTLKFKIYDTTNNDGFSVSPQAGLDTGATQVTLQNTGAVFVDTKQIRVRFQKPGQGGITIDVPGQFITANTMSVVTPNVSMHMTSSVEQWNTFMALNGQQFTATGGKFTFYRQPKLISVSPSAAQVRINGGGAGAGLNLQIDLVATGMFAQAAIGLKFVPTPGPGTPTTTQNCFFQAPNGTRCVLSSPNNAGQQTVLLSLNNQQYTPVGLPFQFYPVPIATNILPRSGPITGGTQISISGNGFKTFNEAVAKINLGGTLQSQNTRTFKLSVVNANLAGFTIGEAFNLSGKSLPDTDVTVSFNGQQFAASVLKFTLFNPIQVSNVRPVAVATGGQKVTIVGQFHTSNLAVYKVRFVTPKATGGLTVEQVAVAANDLNPTQIVVATPAFNGLTRPLNVGVFVTANDQQYVAASNNITVFDPPTVTGFNTTKAIVQGGTPILVQGTGFLPTGISTMFLSPQAGQQPQLQLTAPLRYLSSTAMEFVAPKLGAVSYIFDPFVRLGGTAAGQATIATKIEYVTERRIQKINPKLVPASNPTGTTFNIQGVEMVPVGNGELCYFTIQGTTRTSLMSENNAGTAAQCDFPVFDFAALGLLNSLPLHAKLDVSSKLGIGVSGVSTSVLVVPEPVLTRLQPPSGPAAGLYSVFVIGTNFVNTTLLRCRFDTTVVTGTYHNSTTVECRAPAHFEGAVAFAMSLNAQKYHPVVADNSQFVYEGCAPGTYATAFTTPCQQCPGGTFKGTTGGLSECNECPENSFCPAGSQAATACPANSVALKGSPAASNCLCSPNFYTPQKEAGTVCLACPEGAACAGQVNVPVAKPGFWASAVTGEFTFFECSVPSACPGGSVTTTAATGCATGYAGRMCSACSKRYYRLEKLCEPCPETGGLMIIIASICFVLFLMGLRKFGTAKGGSLAISLTHLQIVAMYADFKLPWPEIVLEFLSILSIVNLNMDLTAPECTFAEWSYENKFYLTMSLPVAVGLGLGFLLGLQQLQSNIRTWWEQCRGRKFSRNPDDDLPKPTKFGDKIMVFLLNAQPVNQMVLRTTANSFLSICSLMYLIVTNKALEVLDCTQLSDTVSVLDAYGEMDCWSERHWNLVYPAVFCIIVYVIGIPVTYCMILYKNRRKLHNEVTKKTYGAVFDKYRLDTFWFEPVVMARKLAIVFAKLFFTRVPLLQGLASMYIFIGSMMLQLIFKPFATRMQNIQEAVFLTFNLLLLLSGLSFMSSAYDDIAGIRATVALITIGLIVVMLVLALIFVARDLRQSLVHITEAIRGRKHKSLAYLDTHFHEEASDNDVVDAIRSYGKQYLTEDAYDSLLYHLKKTFSKDDLRIVASYFAALRAYDKNLQRIPFFNNPLDGMNSERTRAVTLAWIDSNDQDKQGFLDLMALLQYRKVKFHMFSRQVKSKLTFLQQQQLLVRKMEDHHNVDVVEQTAQRQKTREHQFATAKSLIEEEEAMGVDWDEDEQGNLVKIDKTTGKPLAKGQTKGASIEVIEMDSLERGDTLDAKAIADTHKKERNGTTADEPDIVELPGAVSDE